MKLKPQGFSQRAALGDLSKRLAGDGFRYVNSDNSRPLAAELSGSFTETSEDVVQEAVGLLASANEIGWANKLIRCHKVPRSPVEECQVWSVARLIKEASDILHDLARRPDIAGWPLLVDGQGVLAPNEISGACVARLQATLYLSRQPAYVTLLQSVCAFKPN